MDERKPKENELNERRKFLRSVGVGVIAAGMAGLLGTESAAADVSYNRADLARVNELLRSSASEREAFYANPQDYLERHGIRLPKEMIPTRSELEASLNAGGGLNPVSAEPALAGRHPVSAEPALAGRHPGAAEPALADRRAVK